MLQDFGWLKQVKIKDKNGNIINPSTNEKLDELKTALQNIYNAVDELEVTTENIKIEAGQINLNTDELEAKVQSVRDQLDVVLSTRASESTLLDVKTVLDNIKSVADTLATESTLIEVRNYIDTVETQLQSIIDAIGQQSNETLIGRLKAIWDKLVELFETGIGKVRIHDGTNEVSVTNENKLKTEATQAVDDFYYIKPKNKKDLLNSTSTLLGSGETFTGEWVDILDYSLVILQIYSDQNSAIDGVKIQWSADGTTVHDYDEFAYLVNGGRVFTFGAQAQYYRVQYTNGAIAQSAFNLTSILKSANQKASSHRVADQISNQDDAELVKAVITGLVPGSGQFKNVTVDEQGRLLVYAPPTLTNETIELAHDKTHTAINSGQWQRVLDYTVPEGYDLNPINFEGESQVANEKIRATSYKAHATYNTSANTFTSLNNAWIAPKFGSKMYLYVTSPIGAGDNDIITITYTNQDGITGRTATVTIPKSSPVGTNLRVYLQSGDYGVRDITNITHTQTGQAGAFEVISLIELFHVTMKDSGVEYSAQSVSLGGLIIPEQESVRLEYLANSAVANVRRVALTGTLVERIS